MRSDTHKVRNRWIVLGGDYESLIAKAVAQPILVCIFFAGAFAGWLCFALIESILVDKALGTLTASIFLALFFGITIGACFWPRYMRRSEQCISPKNIHDELVVSTHESDRRGERERVKTSLVDEAPVHIGEYDEELASRYRLTPREKEIGILLYKGRNARYIARCLTISPSTVKCHIASVYKKVGVHSQQDFIDLAEKLSTTYFKSEQRRSSKPRAEF